MADLFQTTKQNIAKHLKAILAVGYQALNDKLRPQVFSLGSLR